MTNLILVTGSTLAHAVTQANSSKAVGDWISNLNLVATTAQDLSATGLQVTIGYVKNGGRFAGHQGQRKVVFDSATGSLTQVQDDLATGVNEYIVDLAVTQVGSSTTGSLTYYGVVAKTTV